MKKITIKEAVNLIEQASAVVVCDVVTYPLVYELTGNPEEEWLFMKWEDEESFPEYSVSFLENVDHIEFDGTNIFMKDSLGEDRVVTLLVPMEKQIQ